MRSGWFFGTSMWNDYLQEYAKTRPECLHEWKSSPLANDHDFGDAISKDGTNGDYFAEVHQSQVIDLRTHKWSDVRKSYRGIINQTQKDYGIQDCELEMDKFTAYMGVHMQANGIVRSFNTYQHQYSWMKSGHGLLVGLHDWQSFYVFAYWILHEGSAYYMSGPKTYDHSQHAVIWQSFQILKAKGIQFVEMGQIDGETEKDKSIGFFKAGFGGEPKPFTIVRRMK